MPPFTDEELIQKVQDGYMIESVEEMTEGYRKALRVQLTVQADTELMSAPAYWMAARYAPSTNTQVSAHAIIQDELAHANIAYRLLEDIGESKEHLIYGRQPHEFKHPYGFDQPLDNWAELVVATGFFDRAGITLLSDVHENTSYGPLKRALVKIGMEETFHLRHGEVSPALMLKRCTLYLNPPIIPSGGPWAPNCSKVPSRRASWHASRASPLQAVVAHHQDSPLDELIESLNTRGRESFVRPP